MIVITGASSAIGAATALAGIGNSGLIIVALLFVVARGLTVTGATAMLSAPLLRTPGSITQAHARLLPPVSLLSACVHNTPIVAMFIPVVLDWSRRTGLPAGRMLMPLSYAAILGGTCTLVGTSTNLVVYGLLPEADQSRVGLFTIALIGVPVLLVGLAYILIAAPRLLPGEAAQDADQEDARSYTVEMLVEQGGPVDGRTIAQAGLRALKDKCS